MSGNSGMLGGLGAACYRHRWLTVVIWIAGVACLITLWMQFGAAADNSFTGSDPGQALLNEHFAAQSGDTLTLAIGSADKITSPGGAGAGDAGAGAVPGGAARHRGEQPERRGGRAHRVRQRPVQHPGVGHPRRRGERADQRRQGGQRERGDVQPGRRRGGPGRDALRGPVQRDRGRRGGDRAADRVRLAAGHGAADRHRAAGHRLRAVAHRAAGARVPGAVVLPHRGRADRAGRRGGLRAVHRDQVPSGTAGGSGGSAPPGPAQRSELQAGARRSKRWSPRCGPRAGPCSPRAPRWSSGCWGCWCCGRRC